MNNKLKLNCNKTHIFLHSNVVTFHETYESVRLLGSTVDMSLNGKSHESYQKVKLSRNMFALRKFKNISKQGTMRMIYSHRSDVTILWSNCTIQRKYSLCRKNNYELLQELIIWIIANLISKLYVYLLPIS